MFVTTYTNKGDGQDGYEYEAYIIEEHVVGQ